MQKCSKATTHIMVYTHSLKNNCLLHIIRYRQQVGRQTHSSMHWHLTIYTIGVVDPYHLFYCCLYKKMCTKRLTSTLLIAVFIFIGLRKSKRKGKNNSERIGGWHKYTHHNKQKQKERGQIIVRESEHERERERERECVCVIKHDRREHLLE